jgi:ABC-type antimicrobial peptide transport system permease subunit
MSETSFPVKDLLRRKFQTTLIVTTLTLCVASTLFVLLLADRVGFGISSMIEGRTTAGFSVVFSSFVLIIGILTFIIGGVIVSFISFVMMSQRVRDIGLMKATGCPNDLIFAHFTTELLIVTFSSGFLGVVLGVAATFASSSLFKSGLQLAQQSINPWLVLLVFVFFLILMLAFGVKPILDTTRLEPAKAISPTHHVGLVDQPEFRVISKSSYSMKMAVRNLFRHRSASIRILTCLATVFILLTIAVGGGIIANQTSKNWVEKAVGSNEVLIANQQVCNQYELLVSKFYTANQSSEFNYTQESYLIPKTLLNNLNQSISGISIDYRLIMEANITEVPGVAVDQNTGQLTPVGSNREGVSLVVGVEPGKVLNDWFTDGEFLQSGQHGEAVIGDSVAQEMFSEPLIEKIMLFNGTSEFGIVGVCIDPINNGKVVYVPLADLQDAAHVPPINNATQLLGINMVLVKIDPSVNYEKTLNQIRTLVNETSLQFGVLELNGLLSKSFGFLDQLWSMVMFLPLFSLVAASLCIVNYVMLVTNEQRQEFGVLRAIGAKPRGITKIISGQSLIILFLCYTVGIIVGTLVTWLILIPEPFVTIGTVAEIGEWLLAAFVATLAISLYPAIRFAKKPILEIIT